MQVQWYPGHMTKARRMIEEDLRLIDLVIELVDARIPLSSRNPDIDAMAAGKARILVLCKADLADPGMTRKWCAYFEERGIACAAVDTRSSTVRRTVMPLIQDAVQAKTERNRRRGIKNRVMRALVCGIPNVGKSTFINSFAGKAVAKTGNKPGVTKGKQWIRLGKEVELLDSPGILWPRQEDETVGERLAVIGSVNDEILQTEELAAAVYRCLLENAPDAAAERYRIELPPESFDDFLQGIALSRGCLKKGGIPDTEKAARILIDEFRKGQIAKVTLDRVPGETIDD